MKKKIIKKNPYFIQREIFVIWYFVVYSIKIVVCVRFNFFEGWIFLPAKKKKKKKKYILLGL